LLRDDLRNLKAEHFKRNYNKNLNKPSEIMDEVHFHGKRLDANKYFELKYFLHEDAKNRVMREKLNEIAVRTPGKSPRTKFQKMK
jgi:hypothetical protein